MPWTATTDHDAVDSGATIRIDRGTSDSPPQNGEVVAVSHGTTGRITSLTVVSAAADRLELTDGRRNFELKPHAITKPDVLDGDGRYRDAWIVA
ncbi:hypothetical protein D3273_20815 [Lichenibacterium minor]|jgi:broad specificity phosphatase PhoE|uniref:Uncharacterized protein n=1 Tax=Lichenibacterium minor TaxID=2316528 RepID=A0A4Q2U0V2_9HYPH|nr:hypothetical protein [Lichenibacterium minor]RYC30059.1 hypothetical protein D3273_20815 [Lichenibacterium minor]